MKRGPFNLKYYKFSKNPFLCYNIKQILKDKGSDDENINYGRGSGIWKEAL